MRSINDSNHTQNSTKELMFFFVFLNADELNAIILYIRKGIVNKSPLLRMMT